MASSTFKEREMRAYIKRSENIQELKGISLDKNQTYWVHESQESFHGEISDTKDSFIFKDARLPEFELPLPYVELDL